MYHSSRLETLIAYSHVKLVIGNSTAISLIDWSFDRPCLSNATSLSDHLFPSCWALKLHINWVAQRRNTTNEDSYHSSIESLHINSVDGTASSQYGGSIWWLPSGVPYLSPDWGRATTLSSPNNKQEFLKIKAEWQSWTPATKGL